MRKEFLKDLREANTARAAQYPSKVKMDKAFFLLAIAGEVGELCNFIKKQLRDERDYSTEIAKELADIAIYVDLLDKNLWGLESGEGVLMSQAPSPFGDTLIEKALFIAETVGGVLIYNDEETSQILRWQVNNLYPAVEGLAEFLNIDLEKAIIDKFNEVSDRIGVDVKMQHKVE